uniref:Transposase n=1 Tax=Heterorhabditis bacteriophora TaxID=37862 RepID=A0A1I7XDI3_HETBA
MLGEAIPKHIQKKIAAQREAKGLPPLDGAEKEETVGKKKKRDKPVIDYEVQPDFISETGGTLHPYQLEGWTKGRIFIIKYL